MVFGVFSGFAQEPIAGIWQTGRENTTIEIKKTSGAWSGKIFTSDNPQVTKGKLIIKDLKKERNGYNGKLYVIKRGRWVNVFFEPNEETLQVTVSIGWREKKMTWTKQQ